MRQRIENKKKKQMEEVQQKQNLTFYMSGKRTARISPNFFNNRTNIFRRKREREREGDRRSIHLRMYIIYVCVYFLYTKKKKKKKTKNQKKLRENKGNT